MGQGLNGAFNTVKVAFANDESMSSMIRISKMFLTSGDWTPFVPAMRPFLQSKSLDNVSMKRETVPPSDIEFVTDRLIKVSFKEASRSDSRWMLPVSVDQIRRPTKRLKVNSSKYTKKCAT